MTPLLSDVRLARQAGEGDQRAFEAIFKRYHQDLYRFCLSIVGRSEDAHDALQNTMVKALRALPGERREIKLKPWLYRVAHNESIDLLRRRREGPELDGERMRAGTELTDTVASRERLERLLTDLGELPERQRSALLMRELGGLDYAQISEALESSPAVARQTVYEARLGLRELETGREMSCERVMRQLSEADGRVRRRRDVRAHLRSCPDCRAFRDSIDERRGDLAALTPLPAVAAASILHGLIGGGKIAAGSGLGGAATAAGAGAGKAAGTSLAVKTVATVAVAATVGVTAADRAGLVNVGLPGDKGNGVVKESRTPDRGEGAFGPASAQGETNAAERGRGAALRAAARAKRRRADAIPGSGAGAAPTGSSNPTQLPAGENHDGVPTASPAGSNYGRETSAAHKATNKGKAKGKSKPHPKPSPHSNGSQGKGKNNPGPGGEASGKGGGTSKAHGSPPTGSTPQDDHPAQTEPSGQAKKSEAPTEPIEASGKGAGDESEPSP